MRVLTYTDCCERTYLSLLILELLRQFPKYTTQARAYSKKTNADGLYRIFKSSSTDLYNFIYFVIGDDNAINKLKDPGSAKLLRDKTSFPLMKVNLYLKKLSNGQAINRTSDLFIELESSLNISNSSYKGIRRVITNLSSANTDTIKKAVTQLLFAARAKLRSADLIDDLEKLAVEKDLETSTVADNEPTVSVPDITLTGRELSLYRFLVGSENLALTKKFIEHAKSGRPVSSNMVQSYLPAIKMLDDIVKAGPSYIQLLRTLHKRAKKGN